MEVDRGVWCHTMTKPNISSKQYEAAITAARKAGGNNSQSHWEARLKAAVKRQTKPTRKSIAR
jgi:hypothetical protein